jgi:putative transposase
VLAERYSVALMFRLLRVSRSGYCAWRQRRPSVWEMANRRLLREIRVVFAEVNGIYRHWRIHAELLAQGMNCGRHRIASSDAGKWPAGALT